MIERFADKICVVTGAGSGIGRATAVRLAASGAVVAASDVDPSGLNETKARITQDGANKHRFDILDVSDADAIENYALTIQDSVGPAHYVFNIAGMTRFGDFRTTSLSAFETIFDVNFWGVVRMTKAFLPQLIETKGGIVNVSSVFGLIGYPGQAHYCASKFAVRGFNETIAMELESTGVSVTSVHPGGVATNIAANAAFDGLPSGVDDRTVIEQQFESVARTSPEDAASAILRGAAKRKRRVLIGRDARIISLAQRLFPENYSKLLRRFAPDQRF
ncbi:MAG: SDR family NAD(P)-dependent oxidoreductase [Pseudomonadota bacterium]